MLDKSQVVCAVDLQRRSYQLLKWMADAVENGTIHFERAHDYATLPEAAEHWIADHYLNIPPRARPQQDDLATFCQFFSTFLENSFDLDPQPGKVLYSPDAHCFCPMCSWLIDAPNLKTKKPTTADKKRARSMRLAAVLNVAAARHCSLCEKTASSIVHDPNLLEITSLVAYGHDLLQRVKGISNGPAVLVLWRGFAWTAQGSPKPRYKLTADSILESERRLSEIVGNL